MKSLARARCFLNITPRDVIVVTPWLVSRSNQSGSKLLTFDPDLLYLGQWSRILCFWIIFHDQGVHLQLVFGWCASSGELIEEKVLKGGPQHVFCPGILRYFYQSDPPLVIYTKYCINWQCAKNCECPVLGPERSVSPPLYGLSVKKLLTWLVAIQGGIPLLAFLECIG